MEDDYNEYEFYDPYDCMPFGDAIRFEENQLALEHEDYYDEGGDDVDPHTYMEPLADDAYLMECPEMEYDY